MGTLILRRHSRRIVAYSSSIRSDSHISYPHVMGQCRKSRSRTRNCNALRNEFMVGELFQSVRFFFFFVDMRPVSRAFNNHTDVLFSNLTPQLTASKAPFRLSSGFS